MDGEGDPRHVRGFLDPLLRPQVSCDTTVFLQLALGSVSVLGTHSDGAGDDQLRRTPSGAFDYEFGALDNLEKPLTKSYMSLVYSTLGTLTHGKVLFINLCRYLPGSFIRYIFDTVSDPALQKARLNRDHACRVARELIKQKRQEMVVGRSGKDILSLLGASHQVALSVTRIFI